MKRLYDRLEEYSRQDYYGFHMPGHKRNTEILGVDLPYAIDITEIDGFDDLHHADGILKEAQEARWLSKSEMYSIQWLPADITIIERIISQML